MNILKSVDIENEIRLALADYFEVYCRPLPETYGLPNLLITAVGGSNDNTIDTFTVRIDSRATTDELAYETLVNALGVLNEQANNQFGALRAIVQNSLANWGSDPVRPDLKLCTATVLVVAHQKSAQINPIN